MSALRCPILLGWKTQHSPSPLPWRLVQSGLHWRRLFIVVVRVLDSMWNYSELIKLPQISCSETANPRVSILRVDQVRVQGFKIRVCWAWFAERTPGGHFVPMCGGQAVTTAFSPTSTLLVGKYMEISNLLFRIEEAFQMIQDRKNKSSWLNSSDDLDDREPSQNHHESYFWLLPYPYWFWFWPFACEPQQCPEQLLLGNNQNSHPLQPTVVKGTYSLPVANRLDLATKNNCASRRQQPVSSTRSCHLIAAPFKLRIVAASWACSAELSLSVEQNRIERLY